MVVLLLSMLTNPICLVWIEQPSLPRFRGEYWNEAITEINIEIESYRTAHPGNRPLPVFLFSNLVEDHRMAEALPNASFPSPTAEYLAFPVGLLPSGWSSPQPPFLGPI